MLEGQSLLGWTTRESAHLTPVTFWPGSSPVAALLYSVLFFFLDVSPTFFQAVFSFLSLSRFIYEYRHKHGGSESLEEQICCLNRELVFKNRSGPFKITIMLIHV